MDFRIADTFTDSLARLTGDEQKASRRRPSTCSSNPASPGMSFHKLDKAKDKNFWSVRVSSDIRLIVHKTTGEPAALLRRPPRQGLRLGRAAEAGDASRRPARRSWSRSARRCRRSSSRCTSQARRRRQPPKPLLFADVSDDELLGYGVPAEWLDDVRQADEDTLLALADHLPAEAAEALLELATGGKPRVAAAAPADGRSVRASRRPAPLPRDDERRGAASAPSTSRGRSGRSSCIPEQRQWVERDYAGPARVSGSAGTGKTIVALHRAVHLARANPDARVLLTTFSDTLANALRTKLKRLIGNEPRLGERIDVHSLDAIGLRLYKAHVGPATHRQPRDDRAS